MHRIPAQERTKYMVVGIRRQAPDGVTGIDVFQRNVDTLPLKIACQGVFQVNTDIIQANISGLILVLQVFLKVFLPGPFSNHNHGVAPGLESLLNTRQQALGSFKIKIYFGYQYKIDVLLRQNGCCRNKA